jgi:uncharacterized membrane protein YhaH (DUF805 family)
MFQPLARYFDFQGRSRRSEYWLWFLFQIIVGIIFTVLQNTLRSTGLKAILIPIVIVRLIYGLGIIIPNIAVAVRRFHDIGRTGWWILFPYAIMLVASIIYPILYGSQFLHDLQPLSSLAGRTDISPVELLRVIQPLFKAFFWILLPTWLASLVTFAFHVTDGTPGPNRYGDDPKGRGNANVF